MRTILIHARLVLPEGEVSDGVLAMEDGRIIAVGPMALTTSLAPEEAVVVDLGAHTVLPGFIDLQVNGGGGAHFLDGKPDAVRTVLATHAAHGTTALLATLPTAAPDEWEAAMRAVVEVAERPGTTPPLPEILGLHLEGPFINPARRGVHPAERIVAPSRALVEGWQDAAEGHVRMLTLAPEREGALALIPLLRTLRIIPSLGHSDATFAEARAGFLAGISHVTHIFNALRGFHHREPGALGAALLAPGIVRSVIADGHHVAPAALEMLVRLAGPDQVALVTDAMAPAGMPTLTSFTLWGRTFRVEHGRALDAEGRLAGSTLTMDAALRTMMALSGVSLGEASRMASLVPARLLGAQDRMGRLAVGCDANLVVLDDSLRVQQVFIRGRPVRGGSALGDRVG